LVKSVKVVILSVSEEVKSDARLRSSIGDADITTAYAFSKPNPDKINFENIDKPNMLIFFFLTPKLKLILYDYIKSS
jgi:hypothetical protein